MSSICLGVSVLPAHWGGMRVAWCAALILWYSRLSALLPGIMILYPPRSAKTPSLVSRRRFPWRPSSSGPWQEKQVSERMGRISRSKSIGFSVGEGTCQAPKTGRHSSTAAAGNHRQMMGRIKGLPHRLNRATAIRYYADSCLGIPFIPECPGRMTTPVRPHCGCFENLCGRKT